MTEDDVDLAMRVIEATWKNSSANMTREQLDTWRRRLRNDVYDLDTFVESIDGYGGFFRPEINELLAFHGERVRRARMDAANGKRVERDDRWQPPNDETRDKVHATIASLKDALTGGKS